MSEKKPSKTPANTAAVDEAAIPSILVSMHRDRRSRGNLETLHSTFYERCDDICPQSGDANGLFWGQK